MHILSWSNSFKAAKMRWGVAWDREGTLRSRKGGKMQTGVYVSCVKIR